MKAIKEWVSFQLASKSLGSGRPLSGNDSFFDEEPPNEESDDRGLAVVENSSEPLSAGTSAQQSSGQVDELFPLPQPVAVESSHHISDDKKGDPLAKAEALQIKFLRLVLRVGQSTENLIVARVLHRLQLASLIRVRELDIKKPSLKIGKARAIAAEQEAAAQADLDFSFKILVLGETGVGKSATVNSIFDQTKVVTDAFHPATDRIQEVVGCVNGIKISVIDTPGLLPSCNNQRRNRKILFSVKRFIRKSPPDIVLYFERLDVINMGYRNFPFVKLITDVFGSAIWYNTMLVMTHSSFALPEGPDGYPVSYEAFVTRCTNLVQHYIHQVVSDVRLDNPVLLVENHPQCRTNIKGEKVLPNGQVWRSQLLLLCICTKVLGDANTLLKFQGSIQTGPAGTRLPSLPHLLSSLLRPRSLLSPSGLEDEVDEISNMVDEDEYDQLPPIRILTRAQFDRLSKEQKNDYLDELDYRETLYLKKQWKVELMRRRDNMFVKDEIQESGANFENEESPEAVPLPDMTIPLTFDPNCPTYRYRCLLSDDRWLVRPVLDSQGWDHDVGFDGINLETSVDVKGNLHASFLGQLSKEKYDFNIQTESAAAYTDQNGHSLYAGFDIQTAGRDVVCTVRGDTKLRNLGRNVTGCGLSLTSFGKMYFIGAKLEDSILIGKRLKLLLNAGRMGGHGQVAYGGSLETTIRGKDYPVRNDKISLAMTALSHDKETVFGGNIQSDFRPYRGTKMSINANLNSRRMGQVSVKTSSSEHVQIALIALVSVMRALFWKRARDESPVNKET